MFNPVYLMPCLLEIKTILTVTLAAQAFCNLFKKQTVQ